MPHPARLAALQAIQQRQPIVCDPVEPLADVWASDVFTLTRMKSSLPKDAFKAVRRVIRDGGKLQLSVADVVAQAMKDWAVAEGAHYYAHVFYPLTNSTAVQSSLSYNL